MAVGFKDFMTVDYRPGEDELIKYRAYKRRKGQGAGSDAEYASTNPPRKDEALSLAQRLAKSRQMKKYKSRLALGRKRAMAKMADTKRLQKRAQKAARAFLAKKLTKGISKSELTPARKQEIEKRLDKMKPRIKKLATKMLPKVRKKEVARRQ